MLSSFCYPSCNSWIHTMLQVMSVLLQISAVISVRPSVRAVSNLRNSVTSDEWCSVVMFNNCSTQCHKWRRRLSSNEVSLLNVCPLNVMWNGEDWPVVSIWIAGFFPIFSTLVMNAVKSKITVNEVSALGVSEIWKFICCFGNHLLLDHSYFYNDHNFTIHQWSSQLYQ